MWPLLYILPAPSLASGSIHTPLHTLRRPNLLQFLQYNQMSKISNLIRISLFQDIRYKLTYSASLIAYKFLQASLEQNISLALEVDVFQWNNVI